MQTFTFFIFQDLLHAKEHINSGGKEKKHKKAECLSYKNICPLSQSRPNPSGQKL